MRMDTTIRTTRIHKKKFARVITWEMHEFLHKFLHILGRCNKTERMERIW